jgi:tetratricopeptide (TPR) repeat protein
MKNSSPIRFWVPAILLGASALSPLACVSADGQAPQSSQVQSLLDSARALEVRDGRIDLAAQRWEQVLLVDPNNTEALGGLARAAKSAGKPELAGTYIARLRAINPNDPGIARAEQMGTAQDHNVQLQKAGKLAQQGQYAQAMNIYRKVYGTTPPPGDPALAYYETEAATEEGRPHAIAGLRDLAGKFPGEPRYRVSLGRILTYTPATRAEGRRMLEAFPNDPQAVEALRQSLLWDSQNPASAGDIREYLKRHPDSTLQTVLKNQPKGRRLTPAEAAAAAANASRTAEDRAAYRLLNEKRLEDAEAAFKAILANRPDDFNALAGMGYIRMQQANFGGAVSFLVQAKQDGSKDPGLDGALTTSRFWYTMGEGAIALNHGDLSGAEKQYRVALQMRPDNPQALESLGGVLLQGQQPDAAIAVFAQFAKTAPSAAHAWRGLFVAELGSGNANQALATERQMPAAVRAELSKDPLYLRSLASALTSVGRDADAQKVLNAALNLPFSPNDKSVQADTKLQYADLLLQANRLEQAGGLYSQVLNANPTNVAAFQGLVRVQHTAGLDERALQTIEAVSPEMYSKAMQDGGFDVTVASIYQASGRLDVAQDILEKTLQLEGAKPSADIQLQLAGVYLLRGDAQDAYPLYQRILTAHPDRLDAWKGLIDAMHTTGHDREALAQVQQIPSSTRLRLESDVAYLQTVSAIYNALGQPAESRIFLNRVEQHYAAEHMQPPADVEIQTAWLLFNGMDDVNLWKQLMTLGGRTDLTPAQRMTVQTIWTNFSVRRANQVATAGNDRKALEILNAAANAFPGNPDVIKALASGYGRAGMPKEALAIWKSMNLTNASAADYQAAAGSALAAGDQKDAETWLRFGLDHYPKNAQLLLLGAKFEQQRGDVGRAREYYMASLKAMPTDDPGAQLAAELSRPQVQTIPLPGSPSTEQTLSGLLAPGAASVPAQPAAMPQLYLPGGSSAAPVQIMQPDQAPAYGSQPMTPAVGPGMSEVRPDQPTLLKDYVPQSSFDQRFLPPASVTASVIPPSLHEDLPLLPPVPVIDQPFEFVRPAQLSERADAAVTGPFVRPMSLGGDAVVMNELTQGATFRGSAYVGASPQAVSQTQTVGQTVGQTATQNPMQPQPVFQKPAPQPQAQQPIPQSVPQQQTSNGIVFAPYVPAVAPPSAAAAQAVQIQQAPAVPVPAQAAPATQNRSGVVIHGVLYVPYAPAATPAAVQPRVPPAPAVPVEQPAAAPAVVFVQPSSKPSQPVLTYAPPTTPTVIPAATPTQAPAPAVGYSNPPAEDYSTRPAQYVAVPARGDSPVQPAPVYLQQQVPQQTVQQPVQQPAQQTDPAQTTKVPQQTTGESDAQQYPQPLQGSMTPTLTPTHRRRHRTHKSTAVASATPVPVTVPAAVPVPASVQSYPALSYPGVGSTLGYQPYPVIGPAYPLPAAPTDQDLIQKQVPPLRGQYYTGQVATPNVPLTERQQAERDLAALEASYSGWVGGTGGVRYRSGTPGYDRMTDLEATFEASAVVGNSIRFSVVPKAVFLNSGQLNVANFTGVTGSPIIGTYNTATAANNPVQQSANGIGGELQMTSTHFALAVGYTPYEFLIENYTGRVLWRPDNHFTLYVNRDPVTETQLSYAGLRDPGSATDVYAGNIWGGVVSTGGGVRFDLGDEKAGFYVTADGGDLTGYHVLQNTKFEGSMGAYFLAHTFPGYGRLNVGLSLFGMHYAQNERPLSYGLGGYFSPDAYFLASVPITFTGRYKSNFHYTIAGAVGLQTFQEDSQSYFPLDRAIETAFATAANCTTATIANHTCGEYAPNANTGGNYSVNAEGSYKIADNWFAGGYISGNNTNNYNTVTAGFFVRYLFRPQVGTDDSPTGIFPVEGFRPLRVP